MDCPHKSHKPKWARHQSGRQKAARQSFAPSNSTKTNQFSDPSFYTSVNKDIRNLRIPCHWNRSFLLFDFVFPIQIIWRYPEGYIVFFKVGHFHARTRSFWWTRQRFKPPNYRTYSFQIYLCQTRKCTIWKGINIPSLLKYLDMAPLKLFSNNESIVAMM